ncbi:17363_t:CDS:2, partial [Gigaspora rosea]
TGSCISGVIMTDADPALDLTIYKKYEHHMLCIAVSIFHKIFLEILKPSWTKLVEKYNDPRVVKYLQTLHSSKKA